MLIKYLIFCFGAGLIQGAWVRQPEPGDIRGAFEAPFWFSTPTGRIIIPIIAIGLFIAEVVLGFALVAWWAGIFLWIPALLIASIFIPGSMVASRNPAVPFFIGISIIVGAIVSFLV